jgi:hypothetical protein
MEGLLARKNERKMSRILKKQRKAQHFDKVRNHSNITCFIFLDTK